MGTIGAWAGEVHYLFVGLGCEDAFTDNVEMDLTTGKELVSLRK